MDQLRRYHAVFPPEQVLVLIYDDFRRDNEATVRRVLHFIDVDEDYPIAAVGGEPDRSRAVPTPAQVSLVCISRAWLGGTRRQAGGQAPVPRRFRGRALRMTQSHVIYGRPRAADEELLLELRRRFKGEVEALSAYLGRDLITLWGYDKIG